MLNPLLLIACASPIKYIKTIGESKYEFITRFVEGGIKVKEGDMRFDIDIVSITN